MEQNIIEVGNYVIRKDQVIDANSSGCLMYKAYHKESPQQELAVKQKAYVANEDDNTYLTRELKIMKSIKSPYVVRFKTFKKTSSNIYIFTEYANGGTLEKYLALNGGKLDVMRCVQFYFELQEGFKPLYNENIMHRDIKPENIMLHNGRCKITNFGFGKILTDYEYEETKSHTLCGCIEYMAPQLLQQYLNLSNSNSNQNAEVHYNPKCDVWSMGVIFYEMLMGKKPFQAADQQKVVNVLQWLKNLQNNQLDFEPNTPAQIIDLLQNMLKIDEQKRYGWLDVFQHPLFANMSIKKIK